VTESFDVVIVGGGIAGAGLAAVLARGGLDVCVLERQTQYADRVRGEWMAPWGVAEAQKAGLYEVFMNAGGHHVKKHVSYGDWVTTEEAEAGALPVDALLPGVPGPLCLAHVTACDALAQAAAEAGAVVTRGITSVEPLPGNEPEVAWTAKGTEHRARCRMIVGADGRVSTVRERAGIGLERAPERNHLSGLLVDDLDFPADTQIVGAEDELMYLVFPQGRGRARLYLGMPSQQRSRFTGAGAVGNFLEAFRLRSLPDSEPFAAATVAGPCAAYPGDDTWTDEPFAAGVILVGDAAGYSDPTIGQGLSIAMRDVRTVSEAMLASSDWSPQAFAAYAAQRSEDLRRLRVTAELLGRMFVIASPDAREIRQRVFAKTMSDPQLFMILAGQFAGPEMAPPDPFEPGVVDRAFAV
jgi:menaquinone-9 beta-reductase